MQTAYDVIRTNAPQILFTMNSTFNITNFTRPVIVFFNVLQPLHSKGIIRCAQSGSFHESTILNRDPSRRTPSVIR